MGKDSQKVTLSSGHVFFAFFSVATEMNIRFEEYLSCALYQLSEQL